MGSPAPGRWCLGAPAGSGVWESSACEARSTAPGPVRVRRCGPPAGGQLSAGLPAPGLAPLRGKEPDRSFQRREETRGAELSAPAPPGRVHGSPSGHLGHDTF